MDYPTYKTLTLTRSGHILHLTMNRPQVMNAANAQMEIELASFFTDVNRDDEVRAIIFSGEGKNFSAGGDFEYMKDLIEHPEKAMSAIQQGKRVVFAMLDCVKPIIARVNGHAIGLGATLALFADVSFVADHSKIADPHVAIGFVAGDGGAVIWPQLIGYNRAKEYLMSGEALSATDAAAIGLINHAVPAADLDRVVDAYVAKVVAMAPRAVQWTKASINIGLKQIAHSVMDASMAYEVLAGRTDDHKEALQAIAEKRKPVFTGK
jgi:enoyl-CoA hydratase